MTHFKPFRALAPAFFAAALIFAAGCGQQQAKAPDVKDNVKQGLEQAGLKDVSVSQDRDKGVLTLTGTVGNDADKAQAESIARAAATGQVVSNQISVRPPGEESLAKDVQSDMDKAIEKNVEAVLTKHKWNHDVSYKVKEGVVTLKGKVNSQSQRTMVEKVVAATPNVAQVVNELEVKNQKATSSSS
ncbi:MAG TPA: BON domain-containing protein [Candidatus Acidoferrum sp.]|nr:BON domain-containing protein [Candidatus Acidoferrum sp.]